LLCNKAQNLTIALRCVSGAFGVWKGWCSKRCLYVRMWEARVWL